MPTAFGEKLMNVLGEQAGTANQENLDMAVLNIVTERALKETRELKIGRHKPGRNALDTLKARQTALMKDYPQNSQEITIFFNLPEFARGTQLYRNGKKEKNKDIIYERPPLKDLTEFQFLITNYLIQNQDNEKYLEIFWGKFKEMADRFGLKKNDFDNYKKGFLSQAASYNVFKKLNLSPKLATPKQDAYEAKDMFFQVGDEAEKSLQVKNTYAFSQSEFKIYPNTEIKNKQGGISAISTVQTGLTKKLTNPEEKNNSYLLRIPQEGYHKTTGKPSDECINKIKKLLAEQAVL